MKRILITFLVVLVISILAALVSAQSRTKSIDDPPMKQGSMQMPEMQQMMPMMVMMHPALAVDQSYVYILRGNELLRLDKNTMQIVSRTTLPPVQPSAMPAMPPMGKGPGQMNNMK